MPTNPSQPFTSKWVDEATGLVSWPWQKYLEAQQDFLTQQFGAFAVRTVETSDLITVDDIVLLADTTDGPFTLTLPDPTVITDFDATTGQVLSKTYYIRNIGSTNAVTVVSAAGLIDGIAQKILQPRVSQLFVTDGTDWYTLMSNPVRIETFLVSGTWSWQGESAVELVIVGGGGGGGDSSGTNGGGGGAGGEVVVRKVIVDGDVAVVVGAGGAGGNAADGAAGGESSFDTLTARGGNGGARGGAGGTAFSPDSTFGTNAAGGGGNGAPNNGVTPARVAGLGASGIGGTGNVGDGGGGGGGGSQGDGGDGESFDGTGSTSALANSGGGGGGAAGGQTPAGNGGSGLVIVISI